MLLLFFCSCGRKEWEDRSAKLGESFDIAKAAGSLSDDILRRARKLHDTLIPASGSKGGGCAMRVPPPPKVYALLLGHHYMHCLVAFTGGRAEGCPCERRDSEAQG